jgi:hypothetical protein
MAVRVNEDFITITTLRHELSTIAKRFERRRREAGDRIPVDVITELGKPVAAVMPYETYATLRELLMMARADSDAETGSSLSFKGGTSVKEMLEAGRELKQKRR